MTSEETLQKMIAAEVARITYPGVTPNLYEPVSYTMASSGKRLRPLLCLMMCEAFGSDPAAALKAAVGIEMFHNFTLIHDDVMDRSDLRRGNPTVFAKWGSTQAILSGDALLTLATQTIADCDDEKLARFLKLFNKTALEVYEGQQLDMDFETRTDVTTDEYMEMIRLKTSVLLGCACAMGGYAALSGEESDFEKKIQAAYTFGEKLGLAFQMRDDWLDTFGDPAVFGKKIGGDIRNRKKTWLFITACTEMPYEMGRALKLPEDSVVDAVRKIYDELNLSERCSALADRFCEEAVEALSQTEIPRDHFERLCRMADHLSKRTK